MAVVPLDLAEKCIRHYHLMLTGGVPGNIKDALTHSVTFNTPEFASWLKDNGYLDNTTSIKLSLGIYTPEVAEQLGVPEEVGRLTVFVVPEKDGETNDPFNVGALLP